MSDRTKNIIQRFFMVILALGFFFGLGKNGYILDGDTASYVNFNFSREPLYPIFLWIFRSIFGQNNYFTAVWIFQGLFAAFTTCFLTDFLAREFQLKTGLRYLILLLTFVPYIFDLIGYFPLYLRTNYILTEGISYTLYYWFIYFLLCLLWKQRKRDIVGAGVLAFFLNMLRSQMLIVYAMLGLVIVYLLIRKHKKAAFQTLAIVIASFLLFSSGKKWYTYETAGSVDGNYMNQLTMLSNMLFYSDEDAWKYYTDEELQIFYQQTYRLMVEEKANYQFYQGILETGDAVHEYHDEIKYNLLAEVLEEYRHYEGAFAPLEGKYVVLENKDLMKALLMPLWKNNMGHWIYGAICQLPKGFMRSVFISSNSLIGVCILYCLLVYALAIWMAVRGMVHGKWEKSATLMLCVLLLIAMNVGGIALTIFAVKRYMTYNTGLFYIALILCLKQYKEWKRSERQGADDTGNSVQ